MLKHKARPLNELVDKKEQTEQQSRTESSELVSQIETLEKITAKLNRKCTVIELHIDIINEATQAPQEQHWDQQRINQSRDERLQPLISLFKQFYNNFLRHKKYIWIENKRLQLDDLQRDELKKQFLKVLEEEKADYSLYIWREDFTFPQNLINNNKRLKYLLNNAQKAKQALFDKKKQLEDILDNKTKQWEGQLAHLRKSIGKKREKLETLFAACHQNNAELVYLLIQQVPEHKQIVYLSEFDPHGNSPLHIACENDFYRLAKLLLEHGISPDCSNKFGYKPIHLAAKNGHLSIVELLTKHHARLEADGEYARTPLHMAVFYGHYPIVRFLMSKKVFADHCSTQQDGFRTPLQIASFNNHPKIVNALLLHNANPDQCNPIKETPIMEAIYAGHTRVVEVFIQFYLNDKIAFDNLTEKYIEELKKFAEKSKNSKSMVSLIDKFHEAFLNKLADIEKPIIKLRK